MRKALNDNPVAQIAVVGVLLVVAGFLVLSGGAKKGSESSTDASAVSPSPAPVGAGETTPAPGPAPGTAAAGIAASPTSVPVVTGPSLPASLVSAYKEGKVVVLLVVRGGGLDDRHLRAAVARLQGLPGIAVFTTRARGIARYARITQGVDVSRVPALVVVRPRGVAPIPTAEVRYGFNSAASVVQAVRDALYRGPSVNYSPD